FVDEGLTIGNAVQVRFWVSKPVTTVPIARQIFPQTQAVDLLPTNQNLTHINDDPVPMGLPPGTHLQLMIVGVVTGIDSNLRTWQLGDPEDPIVVYGHAQTIPVTDGFRVVPDIGDEVVVTARRTLAPGPLIADQILILADGPAPAFERGETRTQIIFLYNGSVTDMGSTNGGTRWRVTTSGAEQEFVLDDPHETAVIDRGPLASIGLGTPVTVELLPPTQVLPKDNWAPLELDLTSDQWTTVTSLPAVSATRTGTLFVRTVDIANQSSTIAIPAQLENQAPIANDDSYTATGTQPLVVAAPGVLANDTDLDSSSRTAQLVTPPEGVSSFVLSPDGSFSFTFGANPTTSATTSFTYQVTDGIALSNIATVTITVNRDPAANVAPVAVDDAASSSKRTFDIRVLDNDLDVDGRLDRKSLAVTSQPSNGISSVSVNNGTLRFSRNGAAGGVTTFTYTIRDNRGAISNVATVTVTLPVQQAARQ
ncbi:MAG: Ig-like domain-containing protein, partial [Myxococcaceae bacterium]|nr:Ig-like domain-containing protein [Myxococcaceae bacterium]